MSRSGDQFQQILNCTASLLEKLDPDEINISMISDHTGFHRTSIYRSFPTLQAIYQALARRYTQELETYYRERAVVHDPKSWADVMEVAVDATVEFYGPRPAAMKTLLYRSSQADVETINQDFDIRYGLSMGALFSRYFPIEVSPEGDPFRSVVLMCNAFYSHSVLKHGFITKYYADQAKLASSLYLEEFTRRARPKTRRK